MSQRRDEDQTCLIPIPEKGGGISRQKVRLEVVAGPNLGAVAVAEAKVIQIGAAAGNTLRLNDETVSGIHVEVRSTRAGLRLRDLSSTNGTWVEGLRLDEGTIPPGTVLGIGRSKVRVDTVDERVVEPLSASQRFGELLGQSEAMRSLFALLERVAPTDETVLITGETGTGKDVCARSLVAASPRRDRPFVVVDCGAIPPSLLESELFGHVRGSFTGAVADRPGAFERAQGGTVFLDEIGELPLELQSRLLRAVENRSIRRVGDSREVALDIRIIAATNRRLEEEVNASSFRADLYYRLSVVRVRLPPLRERPEDIELLARHFLAETNHGAGVTALTPTQLEHLRRHRWPGNARELRNYVRRMAFGELNDPTPLPPPSARRVGAPLGGLSAPAPALAPGDAHVDLALSFKDAKARATERFERAYLEALMAHAEGNVSKAARVAQTDRTYLSRLLAKYALAGSE